MQIVNNGIVFITISLQRENATMQGAEKWAADFAKKMQTEQEASEQRERVALMKHDALKMRTPQLWEEVAEKIEEYAKAFNNRFNKRRKLSCHRQGNNVLMVRPDALPEIVIATYFPDEGRILVKGRREGRSYQAKAAIVGSQVSVVLEERDNFQSTPDDIARCAIEEGVKSVFHDLDAS